jgi:hypothetical protein
VDRRSTGEYRVVRGRIGEVQGSTGEDRRSTVEHSGSTGKYRVVRGRIGEVQGVQDKCRRVQ